MFQAGVLADVGNLLVIVSSAVGFGERTRVGGGLDARSVAGRVARAGQGDASESHLG